MGKIRVLLADDHAVLRAGLCMLLNAQPDMAVVGEAADAANAIEKAGVLQPDIVLLDLSMPGIPGLEAMGQIMEKAPATRVLVLTMHDDDAYLRQALQAGAWGYVLKKAADTDLISAIRAVQRGEVYIYPSMTRALLADVLPKAVAVEASDADSFQRLSHRERQVLRLVALGHTNQQIADKLHLSVKTVETYRARGMDKLGLRGRAALVRYALERGLLR